MEFRSEEHRVAVKAALIRLSSDPCWSVIREFAEDAVYSLEQKAIQEDDKEKRDTFICDARGARRFWKALLTAVDLAKGVDKQDDDNFLEVVM